MHNVLKTCFVVLGLLIFAGGCEETPLQQEADRVRNETQNQADAVRETGQQKAAEIRQQADRTNRAAESRADQIEEQTERRADAIEEQGERTADEIEAADTYWRANYSSRPYIETGAPYTTYRDAYLFGYKQRARYPNRTFDSVRSELEREWNRTRTDSQLTWEQAEPAIREAWDWQPR